LLGEFLVALLVTLRGKAGGSAGEAVHFPPPRALVSGQGINPESCRDANTSIRNCWSAIINGEDNARAPRLSVTVMTAPCDTHHHQACLRMRRLAKPPALFLDVPRRFHPAQLIGDQQANAPDRISPPKTRPTASSKGYGCVFGDNVHGRRRLAIRSAVNEAPNNRPPLGRRSILLSSRFTSRRGGSCAVYSEAERRGTVSAP